MPARYQFHVQTGFLLPVRTFFRRINLAKAHATNYFLQLKLESIQEDGRLMAFNHIEKSPDTGTTASAGGEEGRMYNLQRT